MNDKTPTAEQMLTTSFLVSVIITFITTIHAVKYTPSYGYQIFMNTTNGALCLDGSAPDYYIRLGTSSTKFHISFEGGGWCGYLDNAGYGCFDSCYDRSNTTLGTTNYDAQTMDYNQFVSAGIGYYSNNETINPTLYDFNLIFVRYCDGSSFSSNIDNPITINNKLIYFRGYKIIDSLIDSLIQNYGLTDATEVVISGLFTRCFNILQTFFDIKNYIFLRIIFVSKY